MTRPPVATRIVAQALREEAFALIDGSGPSDYGQRRIARALDSVADRLDRAESNTTPPGSTSAQTRPAVSAHASEPHSPDKGHPGPEVTVTHPGAIHAVLLELKRAIEPYGPTPRIAQLLDDAIKLSS